MHYVNKLCEYAVSSVFSVLFVPYWRPTNKLPLEEEVSIGNIYM